MYVVSQIILPQNDVIIYFNISSLRIHDNTEAQRRIWGPIQERVYQTAIRNIDELKERLIVVWAELKQSVIDNAIEQWRPRLRACVQAKGHHFEHLIKINIIFSYLTLDLHAYVKHAEMTHIS